MQKSTNTIDYIKDKQYLIKIPQQISNAGQLIGAVYAEFGETQCLTIFNSKNLFFLQIANESVVKYSSYNMSNINSLVSIIKGYLLITTQQKKLWLFQLKKIQKKLAPGTKKQDEKKLQLKQQQKILTVESYLKQIPYHSYSLRQVTPNMVELFISTQDDKNNRVIYIYQFTIKQKVGGMAFTVDKNNRIVKQSRKQLYASKSFFDPSIYSLIKLKNFSDNNFLVKKITQQYLSILPVCKTEQYYGINKNNQLVNVENPGSRRNFSTELQGFSLKKQIVHLSYLLLQNNNGEVGLFTLQQSFKVKLLGKQSNQYNWQVCFNGKLVGIHNNNFVVKITKQLNRKNQRLIGDQLKIGQIMPVKDQKNQDQKSLTLQTKQVGERTKQNQNKITKQKQAESNMQQKGSQKKDQLNQNWKGKEGQFDLGKQKPIIFKPSKIVGRKDLNKEKLNLEQETRSQIQSELIKSNQPLIIVDESYQKPKTQSQIQNTQQIVNETSQQNQKSNIISARKKQNINLLKLSENFFNSQSSSKPLQGQSKIQSIVNNQSDVLKTTEKLQEKKQQKNQLVRTGEVKNQSSGKKSLSPFSKKKQVGTPGDSSNQLIIPKVSFDQIFGSKPINDYRTDSPLFSKDNNRKSIQTKVSPFKKKQQSLQIQNSNLVLKKQQRKNPPKKIEQQKQLQTEDKKLEKISEAPQQISVQKTNQVKSNKQNISIQNCCLNLGETRQSYQSFSQRLSSFEIKTFQIQNQLQGKSQSLINSLNQGYKRSLNEIIEASLQKSQNLIGTNLYNSVNDYMNKRLTPKVNDYFKNVMGDTKKIYDTTQKFYSDKNKQSLGSLRYHFQQQEHLLNEIKLATADMLTCVQNTVYEGEQSHAFLLKQWQKSVEGINNRLDKNLQNLENHTHDRSASQRQKIIDTLAQLKQDLINQRQRVKKQKQAATNKQRKEKKDKNVVKNQKQRKQKKSKTKQRKIKGERHRQGYYLPIGVQNPYYYQY